MNGVAMTSDPVQIAATQFGMQHFATPLDVACGAGGLERPQSDGDKSSPFESLRLGAVAPDLFRFGDTVAQISPCSALFVGTGSFNKDIARPPNPPVIAPHNVMEHQRIPVVADVPHALAVIRTAFPLRISQIAEILGVSRPTIYAWIGEGQRPQPRCQARLNQVYGLAEFWNTRSNLPLPAQALISPDETGTSLLDMLMMEKIDQASIRRRLAELTAAAAAAKRIGLTEDARNRGFNLPQGQPDSVEFDLMTRRPMDES